VLQLSTTQPWCTSTASSTPTLTAMLGPTRPGLDVTLAAGSLLLLLVSADD
jgi:hypothetical protein